MIEIKALPAFTDNYIWLLTDVKAKKSVCVDPGCSETVFSVLEKESLQLTDILITHHHRDHIGGLTALKKATQATVYGPEGITGIDQTLSEGDRIHLKSIESTFDILSIPGHTLDHISYHNETSLFPGDTLFSIGCGRVFEGEMQDMLNALDKFMELKNDIQIFPAHEYTQKNLSFARSLEPDSIELIHFSKNIDEKRLEGQPSLPTTLLVEKKFNPFLRCHDPLFRKHLEQVFEKSLASALDAFTALRLEKDRF